MALTTDQHDHVIALGRLAKYLDDTRRLAQIREKGAELTTEEAVEVVEIMSHDYAVDLADSLNNALNLIQRLQSYVIRLQRDEDVADSVVNETAEHLSRDLPPSERADTRDAASYALGVTDYARYLRTGEASDQLRTLLDLA